MLGKWIILKSLRRFICDYSPKHDWFGFELFQDVLTLLNKQLLLLLIHLCSTFATLKPLLHGSSLFPYPPLRLFKLSCTSCPTHLQTFQQAAISLDLLTDTLDIFLSPACGRSTTSGVNFYLLPSLLKLLCHSKSRALDIVSLLPILQ